MGSDVKKVTGRAIRPIKDAREKGLKKLEQPLKTGASKQQRNIKKASLLQKQREGVRLAEAEDEVARRRGLASSGKVGRQSLIRSTGSGLVKTLGGA